MSDDHASLRCGCADHARKHAGDVFIRYPVEAVALDALLGQPARKGELRREVWLGVVKRSIETSDLGQVGWSFVSAAIAAR